MIEMNWMQTLGTSPTFLVLIACSVVTLGVVLERTHYFFKRRGNPDATLEAALGLAAEIAAMPPLAVAAAKRAINEAYETSLTQGLADERQAFFDLFATADQKEGMAAFVEKRPPRWTGR